MIPPPALDRALALLLPRLARAGAGGTPTAELYLAHALAPEIAAGRLPDGAPLRLVEPGVLAAGDPPDRWVVLRYASPPVARAAIASRPRLLAVLVDDDMAALARDPAQPLAYRARQTYAWASLRALLGAATDAVAPSDALLGRLAPLAPRARLHRLDPALIDPLPALDHHSDDGPFEVLMADTRSHAADAAWAAPAIRAALDARPALRLMTFLGEGAPPALRHPRAVHRHALSWPAFRAERRTGRAHVSLVPRRATAINAARSATRLLDAAAAGSVGLYSGVPAVERHLAAGPDPLPGWTHGAPDWTAAICRLTDDRALARDLAARTAALAREVGDVGRQRGFWLGLLA